MIHAELFALGCGILVNAVVLLTHVHSSGRWRGTVDEKLRNIEHRLAEIVERKK